MSGEKVYSGVPEPLLAAGPIVVDVGEQTLWRDGERVQLTAKTFRLLRALMLQPKTLITKDELIDLVWDGAAVSDAVLTTAVKDVRKALGDNARKPFALETVHGRGYRFLLDVETRAAVTEDPPAPDGVTVVDQPMAVTPSAMISMNWRTSVTVGALILSLFVIAILVWPSLRHVGTAAELASDSKAMQSIAVLPFDDFSRDDDQAWFADGLAEEILNTLAHSPHLLVASRRSSFRFREPDEDIRDVAAMLGVSHILEGSVRRNGPQIRITVQLIRASDGFHVWSETFDRSASSLDVIKIQEEISFRVAEKLGVPTQAVRSLHSPPPKSNDAYQLYMRARALARLRTPQSIFASIDIYEQTIKDDPDYAPAIAGLAEAQMFSAVFAGSFSDVALAKATENVQLALKKAPRSSDVLRVASFLALLQQDYDAALDYVDAAVANNPNDADARQRRGTILFNLNRLKDAAAAYREARLRDPLSPIILINLVDAELALGNISGARELAWENTRWNPGNSLALGSLGNVHYAVGDYIEAHKAWLQAFSINPTDSFMMRKLGALYWRIGLYEQALSFDHEIGWIAAGAVALSRGDTETAITIARENTQFKLHELSSFKFLCWARDSGCSYQLAREVADHWLLTDSANSFDEKNRMDAVAIMQLLEVEGDEGAITIRRNLREFYQNKEPADFELENDLLVGAEWRMAEGDVDGALQWIDRALDQKMVFPELRLDPVFDSLRGVPAFQSRLTKMDEIAATHRSAVLAQLKAMEAAASKAPAESTE
jgi:TolB-like protein/DNA-binding winged helix-turn-helix (wHTH) protein/Flp pilus assembly protein TadD